MRIHKNQALTGEALKLFDDNYNKLVKATLCEYAPVEVLAEFIKNHNLDGTVEDNEDARSI